VTVLPESGAGGLHLATRAHERRDPLPEEIVAARVRGVLESLGLDLADPHLHETPRRVARSLRTLLSGLVEPEPRLSTFPAPEGGGQPVVVAGIPFHSLCAHHLLPFFGAASIAYLPDDRLVGLSKPARILGHLARRPQVQERLTEQVADALWRGLRPRGLAVLLQARHLCMEMRGVERAAWTLTRAARGPEGERLLEDLAGAARCLSPCSGGPPPRR